MGNLLQHYRSRGSHLRVEIRSYSELPVVHGFSLVKPLVARYVSFCRWEHTANVLDYGWGIDKYRRIAGAPTDPSLRDLADVYDGMFRHLWETGSRQADTDVDHEGVLALDPTEA